VSDAAGLGPTAAIITVGDEIVEGRVLNENATWLSDELMTRGVWPRLVVAVPDVGSQIVPVVRVADDAADLLFVTGRLVHARRHHPSRCGYCILPRRPRRRRVGEAVPPQQPVGGRADRRGRDDLPR
jgi:probable molybdopterin binding protein